MDKFKIRKENGQWHIDKNGNPWISTNEQSYALEVVNILVLSTAAGQAVDIDDNIEGTNLIVKWDPATKLLAFVEKS